MHFLILIWKIILYKHTNVNIEIRFNKNKIQNSIKKITYGME